MWYGRIHFEQRSEELDRSALLISQALLADEEAYGLWESLYAVTSFFAGASDDPGVCEYGPVIEKAYGSGVKTEPPVHPAHREAYVCPRFRFPAPRCRSASA